MMARSCISFTVTIAGPPTRPHLRHDQLCGGLLFDDLVRQHVRHAIPPGKIPSGRIADAEEFCGADMKPFLIYPAIDLRAGKVVRLQQGRADAQTTYSDDPVAVAR